MYRMRSVSVSEVGASVVNDSQIAGGLGSAASGCSACGLLSCIAFLFRGGRILETVDIDTLRGSLCYK